MLSFILGTIDYGFHWGSLCPLGTLGRLWRHFWLSQLGKGAPVTLEREAGDAAKHYTMYMNPPTKHTHTPKSDSAQIISGAEAEKSYYKSKIKRENLSLAQNKMADLEN